jgi:creatinine amidohydrolase/Fe(II)-dependent formamide hydrolase-like protein
MFFRIAVTVMLLPVLGFAQTLSRALTPDPNMPRPIDAYDSVFIEELTWLEVRDAMRAGMTTVIIATGGVEQCGPYLATGKHNIVLRATTEAIARKLGKALVAPIVAFVPEGDIEPPTQHMKYPGTISLREETFKQLLGDIAASLKAHGFEHIILIGDSGGNQRGMKEVAEELSAKWARGKTTIHFIPEYYDYPGATKYMESLGVKQVDEGIHDDFVISSIMMTIDPNAVRMKQRAAKGKLSINGVSLQPPNSIEMGKKAVEYRAGITVAAIRKALGRR